MFSAAVRVGTRLNDWKTKPIRSRRICVSAASSRRPISSSPTKVCPDGRPVQAGHAVHEGRLARTRGSHHRREGATLEGDVDAGQRVHGGLSRAVGLAQIDRVRGRCRLALGGRSFVCERHRASLRDPGGGGRSSVRRPLLQVAATDTRQSVIGQRLNPADSSCGRLTSEVATLSAHRKVSHPGGRVRMSRT